MPLVEITEEQEKILNKAEFTSLTSDRSHIAHEIGILKEVKKIFHWGQGLASDILLSEIETRERKILEIDKKLAVLRKKLGIETPTIHTEL